MPPKLFSFTQFRKNASATPLVSHTFKTKDLKPFRFTHLQKKGWGRGPGHRCPARKWVPLSNLQAHTSNLGSSLSALDSTLTKNIPRGRGGGCRRFLFLLYLLYFLDFLYLLYLYLLNPYGVSTIFPNCSRRSRISCARRHSASGRTRS